MKNFAKKLSALLLSLAMVITMMPFLAAPVMAESGTITVFVNGTEKATVSLADFENEGPQIFPFASKQGGEWGYVIADGPSYEGVLNDALKIYSLDDIQRAQLVWRNADGEEQNKGGLNTLNIEDLVNARDQFKLIDADTGDDITGAFKSSPDNVKVSAVDGAAPLTPIIAVKQSALYSSYSEAAAALEAGNWENSTSVRPYLGGNLNKDQFVKTKDDGVIPGSVNFTGRFSMADFPQLNVKIAAPTEVKKESISMTVGDPALVLDTAYTWAEVNLLYGEDYVIGWAIPEGGGTVVDYADDESADIVAVGAGKATVTAEIFNPQDDSFEPILINEWTITVAAKPAPAPAPAITDGQTANVSGGTYQVTSAAAKTAAFTKAANAKSATVPATVTVNGQTLEVTSIAPNAFAGTSVKTVTVKSKKLTKASVKGSLKGSKVKTVKVKVGKKKENKKFAKKYKKIFTKKNAGKKVKVK